MAKFLIGVIVGVTLICVIAVLYNDYKGGKR